MRTSTLKPATRPQRVRPDDAPVSGTTIDQQTTEPIPVTPATVIPIASGKGGVGKSAFAVGLAAALARLGKETIVVDLDLGAPNLYTLLGIRNENPGIGDFLRVRGTGLSELRIETGVPNLTFLPGDGRSPLMPSVTHAEKLKLVRAISALPAEFVVLDLSGGSTATTLDLFSMVPRGILLTSPELPTFMNTMVFLRNLVFRQIEREVRKNLVLREYMRRLRGRSIHEEAVTVQEILEAIHHEDPEIGERVTGIVRSIRPRLVLNFGTDANELSWLRQAASVALERLAVRLDPFGFLPMDSELMCLIRQARPVFDATPDGASARAVRRLADRIVRLWEADIEDCFEKLDADTRITLGKGADHGGGAPGADESD